MDDRHAIKLDGDVTVFLVIVRYKVYRRISLVKQLQIRAAPC